jgi:hypothetical protein
VPGGTAATLKFCVAGPISTKGCADSAAAALGLVVLALLVALVAQAPEDPYFAASLAGWEQGRLVRFHGMAQWVGWLWPYAAMAWLLARVMRT